MEWTIATCSTVIAVHAELTCIPFLPGQGAPAGRVLVLFASIRAQCLPVSEASGRICTHHDQGTSGVRRNDKEPALKAQHHQFSAMQAGLQVMMMMKMMMTMMMMDIHAAELLQCHRAKATCLKYIKIVLSWSNLF